MSAPTAVASLPPVLADTDVLSYVFKRDTRGDLYRPHLDGRQVLISFMTVAELKFWAAERGWGPKTCERLERFLEGFTVLYQDRALCEVWGVVMAASRRAGRPMASADAWIAAAALSDGITLVTHNARDFATLPALRIISEATP